MTQNKHTPNFSTFRKAFDGTKQFHIESIYNPNTYSIEAKGFDAFFIQNHFHCVENLTQSSQEILARQVLTGNRYKNKL